MAGYGAAVAGAVAAGARPKPRPNANAEGTRVPNVPSSGGRTVAINGVPTGGSSAGSVGTTLSAVRRSLPGFKPKPMTDGGVSTEAVGGGMSKPMQPAPAATGAASPGSPSPSPAMAPRYQRMIERGVDPAFVASRQAQHAAGTLPGQMSKPLPSQPPVSPTPFPAPAAPSINGGMSNVTGGGLTASARNVMDSLPPDAGGGQPMGGGDPSTSLMQRLRGFKPAGASVAYTPGVSELPMPTTPDPISSIDGGGLMASPDPSVGFTSPRSGGPGVMRRWGGTNPELQQASRPLGSF